MKKKSIFVLCVILIIGIVAIAVNTQLKVVTYTIHSSKITDEVKLVFVADLHSCSYGKNETELIEKIEEYQPDAVLLGGDIFDDVLDDRNACAFVDKIAEKFKTYYVSGNHEWWSNQTKDLFDYLSAKGVIVLRGNSSELKLDNGDVIVVSGIDDPEINKYDASYKCWEEQLKDVGEGIEKDYFNLLLSHRPECVNKYFEYNFDAVLAGHAHGGQFRIPFVANGLYSPNQGWFPKYAGGMYDFDGRKMIVSRGLARESTRLPRIFNQPELVFVNLLPQ